MSVKGKSREMGGKRVTIEDVAKAMGVSRGTVSRAFNKRSDINAKTRERVIEVSKELGYLPNANARGLAKGRSEKIGVVCPNLSNPFFTEMVTNIEKAARAEGISAILAMTHDDVEVEKEVLLRMASGQVDGVIITPCESDESVSLLNWSGVHMPIVCLKALEGLQCDSVMFDDTRAAHMVLEHLAKLGHERIAFLAPSQPEWSVEQRKTAYYGTLRNLNLEYSLSIECLSSPLSGEDEFEGVFRELGRSGGEVPTAIFAYDDIIALHLIKRLLASGLRVPLDISVVGMDNIAIGELAVVPLTTVALDSPRLGEVSVKLLLERLAGDGQGEIRDIKLQPRFIERSSTASLVNRKA